MNRTVFSFLISCKKNHIVRKVAVVTSSKQDSYTIALHFVWQHYPTAKEVTLLGFTSEHLFEYPIFIE